MSQVFTPKIEAFYKHMLDYTIDNNLEIRGKLEIRDFDDKRGGYVTLTIKLKDQD
jgi:hypothetical protein